MIDSFWPDPEAFLETPLPVQVTDGKVRCTGLAICDADGVTARLFRQGQVAHFFYEFEAFDPIAVPCGGLEFRDAQGTVVHGKNSFQYDALLPHAVSEGQHVRVHQAIRLDVATGTYDISLGFASIDVEWYRSYAAGEIGEQQFAPTVHCRIDKAASFSVELASGDRLRHHGLANLEGSSTLTLSRAKTKRASAEDSIPALVHVTHWKAGSQWIFKILRQCAPDRIVEPTPTQSQFLNAPLQRGRIYPTVYVPKPAFDRTRCPPGTRHFVVIRDLRDTLTSAYFSFKVSHPLITPELTDTRARLERLSKEEGLLYLMETWLPSCAEIQLTWKEAGEPLIRYEDLLDHDVEILEEALLGEPSLRIDRARLREAIVESRFEALTGRARGTEELTAHERVGAAGDWRRHFTERVTDGFKRRYGGLLVATGYERDLAW
jgi:lipopolysaccharide transport system ATP-binding protein